MTEQPDRRDNDSSADELLLRRFDAAMLGVYEAAKRHAGYRAVRYLGLVRRRGGLEAARRLLRKPGVSEGFRRLADVGVLDVTMEWLLLTRDFAGLFTDEEREIARRRLLEYGMRPEQLPDVRGDSRPIASTASEDVEERLAMAAAEVEFAHSGTVTIRRLDGGPPLAIEDALQLAYTFFAKDASSIGLNAFDQQIGRTDPVRIVDADITTINTTMRARSPHPAWAPLLDTPDPLPWLAALDPRWDLARIDDDRWRTEVGPAVEAAFAATLAPYRNLAVATKVLALKRARLFPILDRLVVEQIGGIGRSPATMVDHLRRVLIENRDEIGYVVADLDKAHLARTPVRVLDALLWLSHPVSSLAGEIGAWQRVMRPMPPKD